MATNLQALNDRLFDELERLNDEELTEEELEKELKRADAVTKIAGTIIKNGELALAVMKHRDEFGYDKTGHAASPAMLEAGNG